MIILNNTIIAKAHNQKFWHAELVCIEKAQKKIGINLKNCTIISSLEPCPMCLYAIKLAKIKTLIILCKQSKKINYKLEYLFWPTLSSSNLLNNFFKNKR